MEDDLLHLRILFIDDDEDDYILVQSFLEETPTLRCDVEWVSTCDAAMKKMCHGQYDACLLDYHLAECTGLDLLYGLEEGSPGVPIIFLTGHDDHEIDQQALEAGAVDYLVKGQINSHLLDRAIRYAIHRRQAEEELRRYHDHLEEMVEKRTEELSQANERLEEEILQRNRVEESLKQVQSSLELRVIERTNQLELAKERLELEIEERKQAEQALRQSEDRYRTLFEDSPVSLWIMDYSGVKRKIDAMRHAGIKNFRAFFDNKPHLVRKYAARVKILDLNKASLDLFKTESKKALTDSMIQHFCGETYEDFKELLLAIAEGKKIFKTETITLTMTEEKKNVFFKWNVPPGFEEALSRTFVSMLDITERKRAEEEQRSLEEQLRQAQKLEAIGTLAGGIAHDFNNILGIILGYAEIASRNTQEGTPLREQLSEIINAGCRARDLTRQILTFSRRSEKERKPLQVSLIVKESLKLLRAALPSTIKIEHGFHVQDDNWDMILADPTQIHQVLMNLCSNAAHAMRESGGSLRIFLSRTYLASDDPGKPADLQPGHYVKLTVMDTGHGIDSETIERIFDPYFTTKIQGEGTGLGLAVVHGIVKSHDGAITLRSQAGSGTSFDIYFPSIGTGVLVEREELCSLAGGNERILFVDDEEVLLKASMQMLEQLGYSVEVFPSSIDALRAFRAEPDAFDLIITDQTMPKMTGIELARAILEVRPDARIILCTGFVEAITPKRIKESGIRELLEKPLLFRKLAETVRKVLDA